MPSFLGKLNEIFSRHKKNWLEKLDTYDLELEKRKLELEANRVAKEVTDLEEEKNKLFNKGLKKTLLEKRIIADQIKEKDVMARIKVVDFDRTQKMSRAIFNLLAVLKRRERLKRGGLWLKLQTLTPDQLLTVLGRQDLEDKEFDRALEDIIRVLEGPTVETIEIDEETQELMDLWSKVEQKEMAPEEVARKLSVEERLKEKEPA